MIQNVGSMVYARRRQINGMMRVTRVFCSNFTTSGCGPRGWPFSVSTTYKINMRMKAATRCLLRGRHASSLLSYTRLVWRSKGVISGPALLLNASGPPTLTSLAKEPKGVLVSDIFTTHNKHKSLRPDSKLGMASCGLP